MTRTAAEVLAGPASGVEVYDGIERPPNDEKLIRRDGRGRPYIRLPDGSKEVTYTRVTTFVGALDETSNLGKWLRRQLLKGVALKPDRILAQVGQFAGTEFEKTELDRLAEEAIAYADAGDKAAIGTAVHALTERHDMGLPIAVLPAQYAGDLTAWVQITRHWTNVHIEHFMVNDEVETGGTPDRIVRWHPCTECGKDLFIVDLKTGRIDTFTHLKVCMQLAVYANSTLYVRETGERIQLSDLCRCRGYVVHLPAGSGKAALHEYDLATGWTYASVLAASVRKARSSAGSLAREFDPLLTEVWLAEDRSRLEELWRTAYDGEWTERHTQAAGARLWQLENVHQIEPPKEVVDNLTTSG